MTREMHSAPSSWLTAKPSEILTDVNSLIAKSALEMQYDWSRTVDTFVVSPEVYAHIMTTAIAQDLNMSIVEWLEIKNLRTISCRAPIRFKPESNAKSDQLVAY